MDTRVPSHPTDMLPGIWGAKLCHVSLGAGTLQPVTPGLGQLTDTSAPVTALESSWGC